MIKSYDTGYHARLMLLVELIEVYPQKPIRHLLKTALREYPLSSKEAQRHWLSMKTGFEAAEILNRRDFPEWYGETG